MTTLVILLPVGANPAAVVLCIETDGHLRLEKNDCECVGGGSTNSGRDDAGKSPDRALPFTSAEWTQSAVNHCGPCVDIPMAIGTAEQPARTYNPLKSAVHPLAVHSFTSFDTTSNSTASVIDAVHARTLPAPALRTTVLRI